MAFTKVVLEIKNCSQCPHFRASMPYSTDGFDSGSDWKCSKSDKVIAEFVEWNESPAIPDWCPIKIEK